MYIQSQIESTRRKDVGRWWLSAGVVVAIYKTMTRANTHPPKARTQAKNVQTFKEDHDKSRLPEYSKYFFVQPVPILFIYQYHLVIIAIM